MSAAKSPTAKSQAIYSIGDLVADLGVSARAIRFYEDQGLLSPQRIGGNRVYTQSDAARLKLILRGKRLGFPLSEIRELLDLYDADRDHIEQLNQTLIKGRRRVAELEIQMAELQTTLEELKALEAFIVESIAQKTGQVQTGRAGKDAAREPLPGSEPSPSTGKSRIRA